VAPPPGNPRFPLFDSLRAIAVLMVLAFHVTSITGAMNKQIVGDLYRGFGNQGVLLFFVISGFLLYRPFVAARAFGRDRPSTGRYGRRRVLRIVPAYWLALTALALFPGIVGVFTGDWWRYYFFLQGYSQSTSGRGIPVAWSLCVEVAFYVSLPLWAMAVGRVRLGSGPRAWLRAELVALALVATLGIAVQVAAARNVASDLLAQTILGECTWLALGMALAVASVAEEHRGRDSKVMRIVARHPGWCWIGAFAALIALDAVQHQSGGVFGIVVALRTVQPFAKVLGGIGLTAVFLTLLVAPAIFGDPARGWPRRLLSAAPLAWLGLISYGVYLWHLAIVELFSQPSDPGHFSASGLGLAGKIHHGTTPILFLLTLAATAVVAALSYYFVELPFLRRKER
jgi:peptidoglycan/LPS O-acetylase OafA/YrhL